jgi:membrane-associated phospholipid phosphatase
MVCSLIKRNFLFYLFILVWISLGIPLIIWEKTEIHLFLNQFHSSFFDLFFRVITFLGDGLMILILLLVFLFLSFRKALIIGVSGALSGLFAQFLKRVVFYDCSRPKAIFEGIADLYFVPGVNIYSSYSFPSGHTATVFGLFIVLALFSTKRIVQFCMFFLALLTAYSRIYLSQHFLIDIYFGGLIGFLVAITIYSLLNRLNNNWIDKSLLILFKQK